MLSKPSSSQLLLTAQNTKGRFEGPSSAANKSLSIHRWTNWIAGFSGDFARSAILQYLPFPQRNSVVMDPFAGVGTTLLEAYRLGVPCVGFELNPFAALVCKLKLGSSEIDVESMMETVGRYEQFISRIDEPMNATGETGSAEVLSQPLSSPPYGFKSRVPFFSPSVQKKVLYTLDFLQGLPEAFQDVFRVALASVMVEFSNYSYEPSLGSRSAAGKDPVTDAPVGQVISQKLRQMVEDIQLLQSEVTQHNSRPTWQLYCASFFDTERFVKPGTVDLVVTSPPYMNNYHYVRNTRPQLFWTGLVTSPKDLKRLEDQNLGKFWQTVRASQSIALRFRLPSLENQIAEIRDLNPDRGVYGGRGWANYIATYMNDLYQFCGLLAKLLRIGGTAVVVIGNSIIQGREICVEDHLCHIAGLQNLSTVGVVRLRNRVGSSVVNSGVRLKSDTKPPLYDAAVVLRRC